MVSIQSVNKGHRHRPVASRDAMQPFLRSPEVISFFFYEEIEVSPHDGSPPYFVGVKPHSFSNVACAHLTTSARFKQSGQHYVGYKLEIDQVLACGGAKLIYFNEIRELRGAGFRHIIVIQQGMVEPYVAGEVVVPPLVTPDLPILQLMK
jgi:hypothetical protein